MVSGLLCEAFDIAVAVDALLRHPHALDEVLVHRSSLVEVLRVAEIDACIGYGRDAHVHIIKPDGVVLRAMTGEQSVLEAVLAVLYELEVVVDEGVDRHHGAARMARGVVTYVGGDSSVFHHGRAHRAAVVEGTRVNHLFHLCVLNLGLGHITLLEERVSRSQQTHTSADVSLIFIFARSGFGGQQCLIRDAPFVAADTEGPTLECSAFGEIVARQFCQFLAILVENGRRTFVIDIVIDAVERGLDGVGRELAIRYFVVGLQQVKRRGGVIDLVGLLRCRGASSNNQGCRCDKGKTNEMSEHVELRV